MGDERLCKTKIRASAKNHIEKGKKHRGIGSGSAFVSKRTKTKSVREGEREINGL